MPIRLEPDPSFRDRLAAASRPQIGAWITSGSPLVAEIVAGSGLDWTLIDAEHSPVGLESILSILQAVRPYPITPVVRVPVNDPVLIKQFLDLGAQNLLVPMVNTAADAQLAVAATRYPPLGVRGVGSALARAAQFNRIEGYLQRAHELTSVVVQIETAEAVENAQAIARTPGLDGVFLGPSDLAASLGLLGQQGHPEVVSRVLGTIEVAKAAGVPVGVNAFDPAAARQYLDAGADFVLVAADVSILARATEQLADTWIGQEPGPGEQAAGRASY